MYMVSCQGPYDQSQTSNPSEMMVHKVHNWFWYCFTSTVHNHSIIYATQNKNCRHEA